MLINREYTNANRPHYHGQLTPNEFESYPKNPHLAQLFTQMGRSEELGTGLRSVYRYIRQYSGSDKLLFMCLKICF